MAEEATVEQVEANDVAEMSEEGYSEMSVDDKREDLEELMQDEGEVTADDIEVVSDDDLDPEAAVEDNAQTIARLEQEKRDLQLKFDRQGNELGEKRKYFDDLEQQLRESIRDDEENGFTKVANDPFGAMNEHQKKQSQLQDVMRQKQMLGYQENEMVTKNIIKEKMGTDVDELKDGIVAAMVADGVDEKAARSMNIYAMPRDVVFNLARRASMQSEIDSLRSELDQARNGRPSLLKNIDKAARSGRVTGRAGSSADAGSTLDPEAINSMSIEEKRKLLAKIQRSHQ